MTTASSPNSRSWVTGQLQLALAMLVMALLVLPISYQRAGQTGLLAAALSALVCWLCGAVALAFVKIFPRPDQVLHQLFFGMVVRMGVPLGVCLVLYVIKGPLYEAGMMFYLLAFYAVTLLLDTYFATQNRGDSAVTKAT